MGQSSQSFKNDNAEALRESSGRLAPMRGLDTNELVAQNLHRFMSRGAFTTAYALSGATGAPGDSSYVSPGTIRNLLVPTMRVPYDTRTDGYPRLDTLVKVLRPLGRELWELFCEDPDKHHLGLTLVDRAIKTHPQDDPDGDEPPPRSHVEGELPTRRSPRRRSYR